MNVLLLAVDHNTPYNYFPIALQLIIAIGFVIVMMAATHLLGPKRKTHDKLINFESGIPSVGNARQPMGIKYFLVAILFVLFDVEVIFFYPYAVNFRYFMTQQTGTEVFLEVVLFVAFFLCGFIYIVKKGALEWED
ncbi:MAG: NADH-quinone oxidoreductase subunit A [Chitinophagales bacterium]